jgi:hypothetical protein
VWYQHETGGWRLGLVNDIQLKQAQLAATDSGYNFVIAPIGHETLNLLPVSKIATGLRPFLSFSVPDVNIPELKNKAFEDIDWQDFITHYAVDPNPGGADRKLQHVGLEASKLAARSINDTYSPFNKLDRSLSDDGMNKYQTFEGLYLGAEMVRVGDPLRVSIPQVGPTGQLLAVPCVMLVSEIQMATPTWAADLDEAAVATSTTLQFKGNIYRILRAPRAQAVNFADSSSESVGQALYDEIAVRNRIEGDKEFIWGLVLVEPNATRMEGEVLGRFYVSHKLVGNLEPTRFKDAINRGEIIDGQGYLNNRARLASAVRHAGLRRSRASSVGKATSAQWVVHQGVEDWES